MYGLSKGIFWNSSKFLGKEIVLKNFTERIVQLDALVHSVNLTFQIILIEFSFSTKRLNVWSSLSSLSLKASEIKLSSI